ncbi:MAG: S-methyl-5-thioribose-1-phosphate isomerase, partial [Gammaproteobacteria bacterium]|nr:S-methyl-5-thioribose-1-phosphate isomerase [Gammaproteobacteria bacterium]
MKLNDSVTAIKWQDDHLKLLDQRLLPHEVVWLDITNTDETVSAIRDMVVRGAPAIGITAAYGIVMAAAAQYQKSADNWQASIQADLEFLRDARPTAVNLVWAINRMSGVFEKIEGNPISILLAEAKAIHEEDIAANRRMGELGAELIEPGLAVLTHCNAGSLATGGYGTALGVIRSAWQQKRINSVYADETRPWLQGARLTAWELIEDGIPTNLVVEGAASALMASGKIGWVIVGSDRIAANGDVCNKIGTCNLAIIARHYGVKFMVVAPVSTCDPNMPTGQDIPIESRDPNEILSLGDKRIAAADAGAWNPVFDITPASLVDAIVTEKGVI